MDQEIKPKKSTSLTEQAYLALREKVITCELAPGSDVSEPELAEQLTMSKTPVREAMSRLCLEGLMEAFPRRGYRVTPVTVKDMNDLFAVRAILEGAAAALAATHINAEELSVLEELAEAEYVMGEGMSTKGFVARNQMFHAAIAQGSKNPRLHALIMRHLEEGTRFLYMGTRARDVNFETNSDHQKIVDTLRARNAEQAHEQMAQHIENTRQGLLQALISQTEMNVSF
jgi:DNA-binding GntR family transcriptional regulator